MKDLFAKVIGYKKPLRRAAVSRARAAFDVAKPDLKDAADDVIKYTTQRVFEANSRQFSPQEGHGIAQKRLKSTRLTKHFVVNCH